MGARSSLRPPAGDASPTGPVLLRTKLRPPPVRTGMIPRARLDVLLDAGTQGRLCLLDAPAGSGKTTLLAQWCLAGQASRRVAWVSLDDSDDDPVRFCVYLIEAFRVVEPGFGDGPLGLLQGAGSADVLTQVVLPQLLNELAASGSELVLVLDDYHLISNSTCHHALGFFIDHLPANVHVVLSTRVDPPLPLARLRARGELIELRIADLEFTDAEAARLLQDAMGLDLAPQAVRRLWERTEGWAAGLVLAGLSLRGRADPEPFIASFEAGHRHVVDYLGSEVLASQPEPLRTFMVRTSILQRLSASLCDAVLEADDSARVLAELEQANLFLIALDDLRQWYRYHHLFARLLNLELTEREPELVPVLHRRAAAWFEDAGDAEATIHHAASAGEFAHAGALIARHAVPYVQRGRIATVQRWLDSLPDDVVPANPTISLLAAAVGGLGNVPMHEIERWLAAAEASDYRGPLPPGMHSVPFAANLVRALSVFDDVGRSLRAARRALEVAGPRGSESYWSGTMTLGRSLYLSGQATEARALLDDLTSHWPAPDGQPSWWSTRSRCCRCSPGRTATTSGRWRSPGTRWTSPKHRASATTRCRESPTSPSPAPRRCGVGWPRPSSFSTRRSGCCERQLPGPVRAGHGRAGRRPPRPRRQRRRPRRDRGGPAAHHQLRRSRDARAAPGPHRPRTEATQPAATLNRGSADRPGAGCAAAAYDHAVATRDRARVVRVGQHGEDPHPGDLPQAGGRLPAGGGRHRPRARPPPLAPLAWLRTGAVGAGGPA
jgi:hypothetical protein